MALTLEAEQRLRRVGLIDYYVKNETKWIDLARKCYLFCKENFPQNSETRKDDVAKDLINLLEINEGFIDVLSEKKLSQKYWIRDFCDLIIDRAWIQIISIPERKKAAFIEGEEVSRVKQVRRTG